MSAGVRSCERLAVVGSGQIACGLAAVGAARLDDVVMYVRSDASADRAERRVHELSGKLGGDASALRVSTAPEVIQEATFVVEAIAEDQSAKAVLLDQLGRLAAPDAILATTTSSLSVARLGAASGRPEQFVGLHVFNPVIRMRLVELVFAGEALSGTRSRAQALCGHLDKLAVEVPDSPGFVVNRLLFPYLFDAVRLAETAGLAPAEIDTCMTLGAAHPMGPLALLDYVGLDVALAIGESLGVNVPASLRRLVDEGALGRKTGRGFHDHAEVRAAV